MLKRFRFQPLFVLALLLLSACNLPGSSRPTQSGASFIFTAAARTMEAQLTMVVQPPQTTPGQTLPAAASPVAFTPTLQAGNTPAPSATSQTPQPQPTGQASTCDQVRFLQDVTYPDGTEVQPRATFVKTWRLENAGTCTWTSGYSLVFSGGESFGAPATAPLPDGQVAPGEKVDVSVSLIAPENAGTYRGEWKLRNANNQTFGVGKENKPFWVQVKVVVRTGDVYDFIARASAADWYSGAGNVPGVPLAFGGAQDDPSGAATVVDQARLETGGRSGKILLTYPRREKDGYIQGVFPEYTVQPNDHFKVRLGFILSGQSCGEGRVEFEFGYLEGDTYHPVENWTKSCNGKLLPVDQDLSSLEGTTLRFVLTTRALGSSADDWAIWNSALIEH